jgi:Protein of unknown function (DUF3224)
MTRAISTFEPSSPELDEPFFEGGGIHFGRARLSKTFHGALEGEGLVEMLSVRSDEGAAGYAALERITGTLDGRSGSFAFLHMGTMSSGLTWGQWRIVSGSGTGELATISGEGRIEISATGGHTLYLDYELRS